MKLIDKDALVAEIEKMVSNGKAKCQQSIELNDHESYVAWSEHIATCGKILSFLSTLEVEEVDLEKEIQRQYNVHKNPHNSIAKDCVIMTEDGFEYFAKRFYEMGLNKAKGE